MPVLQVRLDEGDHTKMKEIADAAGVSVSEQVRLWINGKAATPVGVDLTEVEALRATVVDLTERLAQKQAPPKGATRTVPAPILTDRADSPFMRTGGFGTSRPAPKPSKSR